MNKNEIQYRNIMDKMDSLILYRKILEDDIIISFKKLINDLISNRPFHAEYYEFMSKLVVVGEKYNLQGNVFKQYIIYITLMDENLFSIYCDEKLKKKDFTIVNLGKRDLDIIYQLMNINIMEIAGIVDDMAEILSFKPVDSDNISFISEISGVKNLGQFYDLVVWYYNETGAGKIGAYKMLKWDNKLVGIENYDKTTFEDIVGYEAQKEAIIQNTEAFVNGNPANNTLLIGGRGTGKSSAVKAVTNKFSEKGLRLIELRKEQIEEIPKILKILSKRKKFFIIFIDDLSFDEFEIQYKYMKSILEGGVEIRPKNVLFYATSNRTHIVQEKWIDRKVMETNLEDDVHQSDAIQEKLSLADRFGLTITYTKPTPAQYLEIVSGICNQNHLEISDELIKELAFKWEVNQGNLSGRKAKQFVDSLLSQYQN